jgi:hypothetical protein
MSEFITTTDRVYTWADLKPVEPNENVRLTNRYIAAKIKAADDAWKKHNLYADALCLAKAYYTLEEYYQDAVTADEAVEEAKSLAYMVKNDDCSCPPYGNACPYCRALNTMQEYLGAI